MEIVSREDDDLEVVFLQDLMAYQARQGLVKESIGTFRYLAKHDASFKVPSEQANAARDYLEILRQFRPTNRAAAYREIVKLWPTPNQTAYRHLGYHLVDDLIALDKRKAALIVLDRFKTRILAAAGRRKIAFSGPLYWMAVQYARLDALDATFAIRLGTTPANRQWAMLYGYAGQSTAALQMIQRLESPGAKILTLAMTIRAIATSRFSATAKPLKAEFSRLAGKYRDLAATDEAKVIVASVGETPFAPVTQPTDRIVRERNAGILALTFAARGSVPEMLKLLLHTSLAKMNSHTYYVTFFKITCAFIRREALRGRVAQSRELAAAYVRGREMRLPPGQVHKEATGTLVKCQTDGGDTAGALATALTAKTRRAIKFRSIFYILSTMPR